MKSGQDRAPVATYRVQLRPSWGFDEAAVIAPYVAALGASHLYASPILEANEGSEHGYDVVDPSRLDAARGGEEAFARLVAALRAAGLGLMVDFVPNHVAASFRNPWWRDVLRHGRASPHAVAFDVAWERGPLLLPILGRPFGESLEDGDVRVAAAADGPAVAIPGHVLPLDPATWRDALGEAATEPRFAELFDALGALPSRDDAAGDQAAREQRLTATDRAVAAWHGAVPDERAREALAERLAELHDPDSIEALLARQAWRLASWQAASQELSHRRFFDIADLAGVRVEEPVVFERLHAKLFELVDRGDIDALRLDHVDGLRDPKAYLEALQARLPDRLPDRLRRHPDERSWVVVEKITALDESLPADWPVAGTTGYDLLNAINDVLVVPDGLEAMRRTYQSYSGIDEPIDDILRQRKLQALERLLSGELDARAADLHALARRDRHACDIPRGALRAAVAELTASLPVYRTYLAWDDADADADAFVPPSDQDRRQLDRAFADARRRTSARADLDRGLDFLERLLLRPASLSASVRRDAVADFVARWQQLSGPAMAKGFEDTAFYVYNCLVSLNEVGGEPEGETDRDPLVLFHRRARRRRETTPLALSATSTHDTKRSEDVRTRIDVLSEMPVAWEQRLQRWTRFAESARAEVPSGPGGTGTGTGGPGGTDPPSLAPDANEMVLFFETLVGVFPLDRAEEPELLPRIQDYLVKAAREAKTNSSWHRPNEPHEQALRAFAARLLDPENDDTRFLDDFRRFHEGVARDGALGSLSQVLLKVAAPGVPDFYQGTELWDFSLVDPDNRRPVDFERRRTLLDEIRADPTPARRRASARAAWLAWRDGRAKLLLTHRALEARAADPDLFILGESLPVGVTGEHARHVVALARRLNERWALAVAPRWLHALTGRRRRPGAVDWSDTELALPDGAPTELADALTGTRHSLPDGRLALTRCLADFPVALLVGSAA